MPAHFDPYHQWLSIPPKDQPPDHYRLLGLARFEANVETKPSPQKGNPMMRLLSVLILMAISLCGISRGGESPQGASRRAAGEAKTSAEKKTVPLVKDQAGRRGNDRERPPIRLSKNLLENGGFEGACSKEGIAPGWYLHKTQGIVRGGFAPEFKGVHSGKQCQAAMIQEKFGGELYCSTAIAGGIKAGHDYEARVWVRADRFMQHVDLLVHQAKAWFPENYVEQAENIEQAWNEIVMRFRAPADDPQARLGIVLRQEGRLWIDDASICEIRLPELSPRPGNLVRNGSFEVGTCGWLFGEGIVKNELIEDSTAPHGSRVFVLNRAPLASVLMDTRAGGDYTLSLFMRAKTPTSVTLALKSGCNYHGVEAIAVEKEFPVGTQWKRYELTCEMPPSPSNAHYVSISHQRTGVLLDAVQLEEGSKATPFQPRARIEACLVTSKDRGIYRQNEAVSGKLSLFNEGPAVTTKLHCRTLDVWERIVRDDVVETACQPGLSTHDVTLTPGNRLGAFRAEFGELGDGASPFAESVFAVLPNDPDDDPQHCSLGTHVDFSDPDVPRLAGARWTKTWWFTWTKAEPVEGKWELGAERRLADWTKQGVAAMAVLGGVPEWAQVEGSKPPESGWRPPKDFNKLRDYARQIVTRYKDRIHVWEMCNEPNGFVHPVGKESRAQAYAKQWRALAEGVRQADPTATIVAGSICFRDEPEKWLDEVLIEDRGLIDLCDAISFHCYGEAPELVERTASRLRQVLQRRGNPKPLWDTEWCPTETPEPFYRDAPRNLNLAHVSARRAAAMVVRGFVGRLAAGVERSFLYNGYDSRGMSRYENCMYYESDGRPRPVVAAHAAMAAVLSKTTFDKWLKAPGCWAAQFSRSSGRKLVVAWAQDTTKGEAPFSVPAGWRAFDMMGNPMELDSHGRKLKLGPEPVYLFSPP